MVRAQLVHGTVELGHGTMVRYGITWYNYCEVFMAGTWYDDGTKSLANGA